MTTPGSQFPTLHPPGPYFVSPTGTIQRQTNPVAEEFLIEAGWQGPFATFAEAQAVAAQGNSLKHLGQGAIGALPEIGGLGAGAGGLTNPLTGLNAIGDFFQRLSQASTWIRVGEFIAGAMLLYIALNAMTRGPARTEATRTTKQLISVGKKVAK